MDVKTITTTMLYMVCTYIYIYKLLILCKRNKYLRKLCKSVGAYIYLTETVLLLVIVTIKYKLLLFKPRKRRNCIKIFSILKKVGKWNDIIIMLE